MCIKSIEVQLFIKEQQKKKTVSTFHKISHLNSFYSKSSDQNPEKTYKYKVYIYSGKHRLNFQQNKHI